MRTAKLGDDVYHDDPTVNELEEFAAALLGKDAAIFMPSGTMANLAAVMAHTRHGDEIVAEAEAHILYYEAGSVAAIAGIMPLSIAGETGVLRAEVIKPRLRQPDQHYPPTTLLCIENTHNRAGGTITRPEVMRELRALCNQRGLKLHIDGARIFNAAVALGIPARELVVDADSVCFALSKGLSAPVGSLLAGSTEFVARARRARKMLGGSMRQAGVLAAAGIVALHTGINRLAEDHQMARYLAERLAVIPGLQVNVAAVETNMVLIDTRETCLQADQLVAVLKEQGIKASARPPSIVRFVTHRLIGEEEVEVLCRILTAILLKASR